MTRKPSRILNEQTTFLGLTVLDLAGLGYTLIISHSLLAKLQLEILSFGISGILLFALIGIRAKYRPKTIRDYLTYSLTKRIFFKSGEIL
ncbi:hypothetical protein CIK05_11110 [Bdellovibrio sp. qaytius]|nr:hypothetical protein CIK05_11110 [Bdellovibrio sp. qaytius]